MSSLAYVFITAGLVLNLVGILGVGLYRNLMKKAHCFSLVSNAGMVLFFIGAGLETQRIWFAILCCFLLLLTSPLVSSILGTFCASGAKVQSIFVQERDPSAHKK